MDPQAHAHLTDHVEVPYELLEWVKTEEATKTVSEIKEKSKCISILLTFPRQGKSVYLVTASTNGQRRAAKSLLELHLSYEIEYQQRKQKRERIQSDLEATNREFKEGLRVEFAVDPSLIGLVIGKGGGNVVKVKESTGVEKIIVDSKTNVVRIKGDDPLGVAKAREMLEFKESIMKIPLHQIAPLIGGNGKNINDIWKKSGCIRVHVDDHVFTESNKQFKLLRLVGTKGAVELGRELVDTLLDYDIKFKELRGAEEDIQKQLSKIDINYRDFGTNSYSQSRSNSNPQKPDTNRHISGRKASNSQIEVGASVKKNEKKDTKEARSYPNSQKKIGQFTNEKKMNMPNSHRNSKNNAKEKEALKSQQIREPENKQQNPNNDSTASITRRQEIEKQAKKEKGSDKRKVTKGRKTSSVTKESESSTRRNHTQQTNEAPEEGKKAKLKDKNAAATQASSSKKANQDSKTPKAKSTKGSELEMGKVKVNTKDKGGKHQSKQQLEGNSKEIQPHGDNQTGKSKVSSNTKVIGNKRQAKLESKVATKEIKSKINEHKNGKTKPASHIRKDGGKREKMGAPKDNTKEIGAPKDNAKETKSQNVKKTHSTQIGKSQQRKAKAPARKTVPNTTVAEVSGKPKEKSSIKKDDVNPPLKNVVPQTNSREEDDHALATKKPNSKSTGKKSSKRRNFNNNRPNKNIKLPNKTNQVEEQKEEEGNLDNDKAESKKNGSQGKYKQRRVPSGKAIPAGKN